MTPEEYTRIEKLFVEMLQCGYRLYGIVPISSIDALASLNETVNIDFDYEFKEILYGWKEFVRMKEDNK